MLVIGKAGRVAVALCALALFAGCSDDADPAPDSSLIDLNEMRGALLQAKDVGDTWLPPDQSADPNQLVSICGGTTKPPTVPPGGEVVASPLVDEGQTGAQALYQTAIVYGDPSAAKAGLTAMRAVADGCAANVSVPRTINDEKSEPAYTEKVSTQPLAQGGWSGFAVLRHKQYEAAHPGTADTAVAILANRNVLLVDSYAIYRLGPAGDASAAAQFSGDWQRLVGTVVNRVG
jgi:hypothetical protein